MKIMVFEWMALSQDDLEAGIRTLGYEIETFMYRFSNIYSDAYFSRHFSKTIEESGCECVISWNFWPLVADVCFEKKIPYIAWVYDCPISYNIDRGIRYPTSHVFMFDKEQYLQYHAAGAAHVYHMPLAVNTARIDEIIVDEGDKSKFECDISFLGTMYDKEYSSIYPLFTDFEAGYFEGILKTQQNVYGSVTIDKNTLSRSFVEPIKERWIQQGVLSETTTDEFIKWLRGVLLKEVTKRDRISLLSVFGKCFDTKYFSYEKHDQIQGAKFSGMLGYKIDMFKLFKSSKINLNITYRMITKGISLRALDIMAAGGFLLSNWQEELVEYFEPGVDFVYYDSLEDAYNKAKYYLTHEDERKEIAQNGHKAVKRFDYQIQLKRVFEEVFE